MASFKAEPQDPDARLDYTIDWTAWLGPNETLVTAVWAVDNEANITLDTPLTGTKSSTVWVSDLVVGSPASATVHIVTNETREDDRTIIFRAKEL